MMSMIPDFPVPAGTGRASPRPLQDLAIPGLVAIYLIFILPVYVDNNAGQGLMMPQNLLAWGVMVLCVLAALLKLAHTGQAALGGFMLYAAVGGMLLVLPWLWTTLSFWRLHALPRVAGIAGALLFALSLCQTRMSPAVRRGLLAVVVVSALVQSGDAMMQAWLPGLGMRFIDFNSPSPYGIFQQRNALANWLATGSGVALYLALTARNRARTLGWVITLYPLCAALTLLQIRTSVLGLLLSGMLVAMADLPRVHRRPLAALRRVMLLISLLAWCTSISLWAMPSGRPADLEHAASTYQRALIIQGTLAMIKQHPLAGSGLGSFEARFPYGMADAGLESTESDTFTHPYNEILFVMAEGGVPALAGLLLLSGVWLWPVLYRLCHPLSNTLCPDTGRWLRGRESLSAGNWLLPLTGLPILVHMMIEYPLYLSAPHLMLLLLLFRIGLPETALRRYRISGRVRAILLLAGSLASCVALGVLWAGLGTQSALTRAEMEMNAGLLPSLPDASWRTLTQAERLDYDRHMLMASTPGFLQRPRDLVAFTLWGKRWLVVHNNAEVSAAMMLIAQRRGDHASAERLREEAARVFVHDSRFLRGKG
ncbi:O-antigen ligase family protein [Klebsiella aerogenes]|uniref:O-antigen ligase family protein n=2 Tax=Klebsiella aerogenes TaxID=548 RepID=UPI001D17FC91|nr:O-antigen ligase family protein [Klebsiella aerogenes]